jgi:hypothetical protein
MTAIMLPSSPLQVLSLLALLVQKYKCGKVELDDCNHAAFVPTAGTQFTCFTSTKVQILTDRGPLQGGACFFLKLTSGTDRPGSSIFGSSTSKADSLMAIKVTGAGSKVALPGSLASALLVTAKKKNVIHKE